MKLSSHKTIIFACVTIFLFFFIVETGLRIMYFQKKSTEFSAITLMINKIKNNVLRMQAEKKIKEMGVEEKDFAYLYTEIGNDLWQQFIKRYENEFIKLLTGVKEINAKLIILYLPSENYRDSKTLEKSKAFFQALAGKYELDFIDLTDEFMKYDVNTVTLFPENGHLSRFGNKLIAEKLITHLKLYNEYRSLFHFDSRPKLMGDHKPNYNNIVPTDPHMPYFLTTNKQGLRMNYDLEFPKVKQRILVLGDSYTYGPYLYNFHTYPALIDKELEYAEVINAGVAGSTITNEASLFNNRSKYTEPDIVVLQVLDNDIWGLFYFKENEFDRDKKVREPSVAEMAFVEKVLAYKKVLASQAAQPIK